MGRDPTIVIVGIAGLVDEIFDHPVEQEAVIEALPGQQLHPGHGERREVGAHLHHDAAFGGVDDQGVVRIQRPPLRRRAQAHHPKGGQND